MKTSEIRNTKYKENQVEKLDTVLHQKRKKKKNQGASYGEFWIKLVYFFFFLLLLKHNHKREARDFVFQQLCR